MEITTGKKAPDFTAQDQDGTQRSLSDYKGSWVLLYFYPRDFTPGCTTEACELREQFPKLSKSEAVVLGISTDTVKSHKKFADKYNLPFTLIADPDKKIVSQYGVYGDKKFFGRVIQGTKRSSFLIDPSGIVVKIYERVKPAEHASQVLADLRELQQK